MSEPATPRRLGAAVAIDQDGPRILGLVDLSERLDSRLVLAESPPPGIPAGLLGVAILRAEEAARNHELPVGLWQVPLTLASGEVTAGTPRRGTGGALAAAALEAATGLDLESLTHELAAGASTASLLTAVRGHALATAISALDPEDGFAPSPGRVAVLRLASGPGLRTAALAREGETLPATSGGAITLLSAWGRDRAEAIARLHGAVRRSVVLVAGGGTDQGFVSRLLSGREIERFPGSAVAALASDGDLLSRHGDQAALVYAAIAAHAGELTATRERFFASAARGRPEVPEELSRGVELRYRGRSYLFHVERLGYDEWRLESGNLRITARLHHRSDGGVRLEAGMRSFEIHTLTEGDVSTILADGVPHRVVRREGQLVRSPATALVVGLPVRPGTEVRAGTPLVVLEAMKLETTVNAETDGRVRELLVHPHQPVAVGAPLLVLEPLARPAGEELATTPAVALEPLADAAYPRTGGDLEELCRFLLGYDAAPEAISRLLTAADAAPGTEGLVERGLAIFADLAALFRRREDDEESDEASPRSVEESLFTYLRDLGRRGAGLPEPFLARLRRALAHYGVASLDPTPELEEALFRIARAQQRQRRHVPPVLALLERVAAGAGGGEGLRDLLDRLIRVMRGREPNVYDLAREVRFHRFDRPFIEATRRQVMAGAERALAALAGETSEAGRERQIAALTDVPQPLYEWLVEQARSAPPRLRCDLLAVIVRRYYRDRKIATLGGCEEAGEPWVHAEYDHAGNRVHVFATFTSPAALGAALATFAGLGAPYAGERTEIIGDFFVQEAEPATDGEATAALAAAIAAIDFPAAVRRIGISLFRARDTRHFTFRRNEAGQLVESEVERGLHPMLGQRLQLWRLSNFALERLDAPPGIYLLRGRARTNPKDERLFALAEVQDLTPIRDITGRVIELPALEHTALEALAAIRRYLAPLPVAGRPQWNRLMLFLWPPVYIPREEIDAVAARMMPQIEGLGLEKVVLRTRIARPGAAVPEDLLMEISNPGGHGPRLRFRKPRLEPLAPMAPYEQKVVELRRRGLTYAYELVRMLAPGEEEAPKGWPHGDFVEHDLDASGKLVPVTRPRGENTANIVAGVVRNFTPRYPEGIRRVIVLGDGSRGMGALAEPECRRIVAALDLAEELGVPLEWFALSAGAKIAMDSGTENMDWISRVLRRIVTFTQGGGEIHVVVCGINVGAQPYWNAEATMLMHTRGILIMTPDGAMVLTGKQALDYSGGVSADDNVGIGGYDRIMGPNGQAQYLAADLEEACRLLLRYYDHSYRLPTERFPRPAPTTDPRDRDVCVSPHGGEFATIGEVLDAAHNPGRKRPFEIRRLMAAVVDQDHPPLERWQEMRDAETGVVWDAHLGGHPVSVIGFESRPVPRLGWVPSYGPEQWTAGTLFPLSSKKIARAINSASGSRPLVVLANLSGFDGSPESMRNWQLEFGAEIGRAVVNFRGPIVFCVVSRYHGGAFVVFSKALHDNMQVAALEGTYASVIGGAPAAAVVFAREVDKRTRRDPRIVELERELADPGRGDQGRLRARFAEVWEEVHAEKLAELAVEYDRVHSVERARDVGSVDEILPAVRLRPWLIEALERGMAKEEAKATS
ncbi:MAG: biotin attachment protein [Acidobacteria bacterium]|nr:biotin attachment protein [Acidobacteriota bacterium]